MENANEVREHLNYALAHAENLCRALKFALDNIRQPDFTPDDLAQNVAAFREKIADVQRYLNLANPPTGRPGRISRLDRGYESLDPLEYH